MQVNGVFASDNVLDGAALLRLFSGGLGNHFCGNDGEDASSANSPRQFGPSDNPRTLAIVDVRA